MYSPMQLGSAKYRIKDEYLHDQSARQLVESYSYLHPGEVELPMDTIIRRTSKILNEDKMSIFNNKVTPLFRHQDVATV